MHEQPEPTEEEDELAATERQRDEDAMRGYEHDDPPRPHEDDDSADD